MLKLLLSKSDFEGLDPAIQAEYKPKAGETDKYELDVEGGNPGPRLKEFRDRNIALDQELNTLKKAWEGLDDPAKVREVMGRQDEIMKGEVFKKGTDAFNKEIDTRTAAMKAELDKKAADALAEAATLRARLEKLEIDDAIKREAVALNVEPLALDDFVSSHRGQIRLENGVPVVYEADGKTQVYGADSKPIQIKEFVDGLAKKKHWFFKPSEGSGSKGSGGGTVTEGETQNPWSPKYAGHDAKTKQMALMGSDNPADKAKARRLAAEHGIKLDI